MVENYVTSEETAGIAVESPEVPEELFPADIDTTSAND